MSETQKREWDSNINTVIISLVSKATEVNGSGTDPIM